MSARTPHTHVSYAAAVLLLALSVSTTGCSVIGRDTAALDSPLAIDVVALAMDNARKTAELSEGFPFQVPVFGGRVDLADTVTPGSVWAYEIATPEPPPVVTEWYRRAYANANWILMEEGRARDGSPHNLMLYFTKGVGAESVIEIADNGSGGTLITATVALGARVRETH